MGDEQEKTDNVRLVEFYSENFMNTKVVAFKPQGHMTIITGGNGQGKTSTLDGIAYVLGGASWAPAMPTRKGAGKHLVRLGFKGEKGSFYFFRTQSGGVHFEAAPGCTAWGTPQAMINSIFNELALDPIGFVRQKPKEQVKTLRDYLGLTAELEKLEAARDADYDSRRILRRDLEKLQAEAAGIAFQDGLPKEKIDESEIKGRISQANEENKNLTGRIEHRARLAGLLADAEQTETKNLNFIEENGAKVEGLARELAHLEPLPVLAASVRDLLDDAGEQAHRLPGAGSVTAAIEAAHRYAIGYINDLGQNQTQLRGRLDQARLAQEAAEKQRPRLSQAVADARTEYDGTPAAQMIDTAALMEELEQAQLVNREIDKRTRRQEKDAEIQAMTEKDFALTRAINAFPDKERDMVAAARMPMEGMTMTGTEVLFDNVPIQQLGEAKQVELGIALVLAGKPKLRLIRIPHGESLDDKTMAHLAKLAEEQDFYVWMAKVDTSGKVGIYLEDGEIKANNEAPAAAPAPEVEKKGKTKRKEELA
jgi:hypothetical protein